MAGMKWNRSKQVRQTRQVLSWAMLVMITNAAIPASLAAEAAGKSVYTGVDHYGVRWFSDATPANGVHYTTLSLPGEPSPATSPAANSSADTTATTDLPKRTRKPAARRTAVSTLKAAPPDIRLKSARSSAPARARTVDRAAEREARQQARRCQRYDAGLRKIADQLRAGYHARSGRKLHQRQRQLQDQQYAECPTRSG